MSSPTSLAEGESERVDEGEVGYATLSDLTLMRWALQTPSDGATLPYLGPAPLVRGIKGALRVVAGVGFACVRTSANVSCWGDNVDGDGGDGTTTPRISPVPIL